MTDEFATVSPYQYALNDPVSNIDEDGLAVLPVLAVTAQAVNRMSVFSSFTSSILAYCRSPFKKMRKIDRFVKDLRKIWVR